MHCQGAFYSICILFDVFHCFLLLFCVSALTSPLSSIFPFSFSCHFCVSYSLNSTRIIITFNIVENYQLPLIHSLHLLLLPPRPNILRKLSIPQECSIRYDREFIAVVGFFFILLIQYKPMVSLKHFVSFHQASHLMFAVIWLIQLFGGGFF